MLEVHIDDKFIKESEDIDEQKIKKIIEIAIEDFVIKDKHISVSIKSVSRSEIKSINKEYRNIDKETDVLSFPMFTKDELLTTKFDYIELGDIIICIDIIKEQGDKYQTGFERELLYMITHGICHLLGYDHETEEEKNIMRQKEESILNLIGVSK